MNAVALMSLLTITVKLPSSEPMSGVVAWINPPHAQGNRPQGIGIRLPDNEVGKELKKKIEGLLAPVVKSDRPTATL